MASVSSTGSSNTNNISAKTGFGGLVTGMDIDELVEKLTTSSRQKILKQEQSIQKLEWQQTGYRSVTKTLKEFQAKYLDILSKNNLRSEKFFNTIKANFTSSAVDILTNSNSYAGSFIINKITQLATNQVNSSNAALSKALEGSALSGDYSALATELKDKSIGISLNGKLKTITFDQNFIDNAKDGLGNITAESFKASMQESIDNAFGSTSGLNVTINSGKIMLDAGGSVAYVKEFPNLEGDNSDTALKLLGFNDGQSNKINVYNKLSSLNMQNPPAAGADDKFNFKINGVEFSIGKDETLSSLINQINSSKANVTISYSSISDKMTLTSKDTGSGNNIQIEETGGNLLTVLGLNGGANGNIEEGKNAILTVDGKEIIRSSNEFDISGTKVILKSTTIDGAPPISVKLENDGSALVDSIKGFVEDYNNMIELINGLTKEKQYKDYPPLSKEQKEDMSEKQIEEWEKKAKSGILRNDNLLNGFATKMQTLMYSSVDGYSLHNLGIESAGWTENGKLKIDEDKLTEALKTDTYKIKNLFSSAGGLGDQMNDLIDYAAKTSGAPNSRGYLVRAAGYDNTTSDKDNNITKSIGSLNDYIKTLKDRLKNEESRYWSQFTAMETAISKMNTQSAMFTQFSAN